MWPFRASVVETRSTNSETDILVDAIQARVSGRTPEHATLAIAEACAGLWERALASATVMPMSSALMPVTPDLLALVARGLASRGEFVALLRVNPICRGCGSCRPADGICEVVQISTCGATGWTWAGLRPRSRRATLNPDQVLHFRIGASPQEPWRGRSPLRRSRATADLAVGIEGNLILESNIKPTRIASTTGTPDQAKAFDKALAQGGIFGTSFGQPLAGQQVPSSRWEPAAMGPEPDEVFRALRTEVGENICAAFGISPALFNCCRRRLGAERKPGEDIGPARWRRSACVIQAELREKLDPDAEVAFDALRASDEDGRSRAVSTEGGGGQDVRRHGHGARRCAARWPDWRYEMTVPRVDQAHRRSVAGLRGRHHRYRGRGQESNVRHLLPLLLVPLPPSPIHREASEMQADRRSTGRFEIDKTSGSGHVRLGERWPRSRLGTHPVRLAVDG